MKEVLIEKGFTVEEPEALLILDIESKPELIGKNIAPEIVRVLDEEGIDGIVELENTIWNESHSELGERLKRDLKDDPGNLLIYAAILEGKVVSGAWMYLHKGTSLIAIRAKEAFKKGYKLLTVDASPMSAPTLEKHGFDLIAYSYPCNSPK